MKPDSDNESNDEILEKLSTKYAENFEILLPVVVQYTKNM